MNTINNNNNKQEESINKVTINDSVLVTFEKEDGETYGPAMQLPLKIGANQLHLIVNQLNESEESIPFQFYCEGQEIKASIYEDLFQNTERDTEKVLKVICRPQAVFKVRPVTRCSSTLKGHQEAILVVKFSPDGRYLASGSGDTTVRLWDLNTETPKTCLQGHKNWVLNLEFSPDAKLLASGGMDGLIFIWDPKTASLKNGPLKGHRKWITSLAWEPYHINPVPRLASASKDGTIRIWNVSNKTTEYSLSGHSAAVTSIRWGGGGIHSKYSSGVIYSASQDRTIKVWDANKGTLIMNLTGHAHWVNTLALSSDFVLRTGPFDHHCKNLEEIEDAQQVALKRYQQSLTSINQEFETLVSGSDDFTMFLWQPFQSGKPIQRLTGHQKLVNHVQFSPDGRWLASASFDNSVKLWDAKTGSFIKNLRSHVSAIYQIAFSSDSRLLVSASKDSTCKLFDIKTGVTKVNLNGHLDEVYAIDWSPKGDKVVSAGKDKTLKLWRY